MKKNENVDNNNNNNNNEYMINVLLKENYNLRKKIKNNNNNNNFELLFSMMDVLKLQREKIVKFENENKNLQIKKEKLLNKLKNEDFKYKTNKFINKNPSNSSINTIKSMKNSISSKQKKKFNIETKKEENVKMFKIGDEIKKNTKIKLLTNNNKINNNNNENDLNNKNNKNINKSSSKNNFNIDNKKTNKNNKNYDNKKLLNSLNSLNSLQYNYDNLMSLGLRGNKNYK